MKGKVLGVLLRRGQVGDAGGRGKVHSVSRVGSLVDAARLVLEGLVLFWLEVKVGRSSTMVGLLAILVPTGCLIAGSLMAMPWLA